MDEGVELSTPADAWQDGESDLFDDAKRAAPGVACLPDHQFTIVAAQVRGVAKLAASRPGAFLEG